MERHPFQLSLLTITATDGVQLPALLYEPSRRSRRAVVWLHGNGGASVFYSGKRMNVLGEELTRGGFAFLALNNRGAETEKVLKRRVREGEPEYLLAGFSHELIRDCIADIDGCIRTLRGLGYSEISLAGHSTGANKICVYNFYNPRNRLQRFILLGPGDDVGIYYQQLGEKRFRGALDRARERVRQKRGNEIVPKSISARPISWRSLLDTIDPNGDYNVFPFLEVMRGLRLSRKEKFRHYRSIRKPTVVLFGENDEFCFGDVPRCLRILDEERPLRVPIELGIIEATGHSFHGAEQPLGAAMTRFLRRRFP